MIEKLQRALDQEDYNAIQDIWTDMVLDASIPVDDFLIFSTTLKEQHKTELAIELLDMLGTHYESERHYTKAILVYKHLLFFKKEDKDLRQHLIDLYRKSYPHSEHLNTYLELSGVTSGDPILRSLERLDHYLSYDVGKYFFFERYGIGQVVDVNPEKKEIVLDFEKKKRHFLTLRVAQGLLTPLHENHFLYLKHKNFTALKELATTAPDQLLLKLLKDYKEPLTSVMIKKLLQNIIDTPKLNKFWEQTRKDIEKNPHVKVSGRTNKTYQYLEAGIDKKDQAREEYLKSRPRDKYILALEYQRSMPDLVNELSADLIDVANIIYVKDPALAIDILLFCKQHNLQGAFKYSLKTLLEEHDAVTIIKKITLPEHQKQVIDMIQQLNPGTWTKLFKNIILTTSQPKILDEMVLRFKEHPTILKDTFYTIISMPKSSPYAYQWMLKKMLAGEMSEYLTPAFTPRLIESLDHVTGIRSVLYKILDLETFDGLMQKASIEEAQRILETINTNETLEEYRKNDFSRIVVYHFPQLLTSQEEIIYSTQSTLLKKQAELEHLLNVEIPANKKEISRAREYGDLSENFEYKAAREKQAQLLEKVRILEQTLNKVVVLENTVIATEVVSPGTKVTLTDTDSNTIVYTILGRWDTDIEHNIISNEAPIAQSMLDKKVGDTILFQDMTYTIRSIENALQ